ncbi:MAG: DUF4340 domain-containing protein [Candidatus Omnitrophica bacterium]|nr:DUF4340 domain-containing protein [Candidatus Omnitrophota bacterium]
MKAKQIIVLAVVFLLLAAGVVLKKFYKPVEISSEFYTPLDISFETGQVAAVEIAAGKTEPAVVLVKENNIWKIPGLWDVRADQEKIEGFLNELRQTKGELRAKDKNIFGDFGIGDEEAWRLVLKDQNQAPLASFLFGTKREISEGALFLRRPDSEMVYLINFDFFNLIGIPGNVSIKTPAEDFWADFKILPVSSDQIQTIEILHLGPGKESKVLNLVRSSSGDTAWKFGGKEITAALDQEKLKNFLQALGNWSADQILDPAGKDYGFEAPTWQMKLSTVSGQEILVTRGGKNPGNQNSFFKVSTSPAVFEVSPYFFQNVDRDRKYFFSQAG